MIKYLLALVVVLNSAMAIGQTSTTGSFTDAETGESLIHVIVVNKKTGESTTSDVNGTFKIAAQHGDTLKVILLGYTEQDVIAKENLHLSLSSKNITLDEIIVTSNREETNRKEVPIAISTISATTIKDNKPTSIDQVLNQVPGVNMVNIGNEQHTMSIRRPIDYGASYLYLEDGVPIRASGVFNHNALLEINMAAVSKIELVRGPSSSMYGAEAIGGAVNFISAQPSLKPSAGISIQQNTIGYKRGDLYASTTIGKLGVRLSGYYANQRNGYREYSNFAKASGSLALNYQFTKRTNLEWSTTYVDYKSDMTGSLTKANFFDESYKTTQTFTYRNVNAFRTKFALTHQWNEKSKTMVIAYGRANSIKQNPAYSIKDDFKPWMPKAKQGDKNLAHGQVNDNSFRSYGGIVQHKQDFNFLNSSLIVGTSVDFTPNKYRADDIVIHKTNAGVYDSFKTTDSSLAKYNADILNYAAYTSVGISPVKGLILSAGVRYDYFQYTFKNLLDSNAYTGVKNGQDVYNRLTPKVGFTYNLDHVGVYANYSQGYVPPQVTELYVGKQSAALLPVTYNSTEAGTWISLLHNKAKIEATVFQMDGKNEIISVLQDDGSTRPQNAGSTRHKGVEFAVNYTLIKGLHYRLSGTYAEHKFINYNEGGIEYSTNNMAMAPNWIVNSQLTYKPVFLKELRVSAEWQHINEYYMDAANTTKYGGYDVFNIRLGYEWKSLEVWSNIMNVSNQRYATAASTSKWGAAYTPGNPINITLGLGWKFTANN